MIKVTIAKDDYSTHIISTINPEFTLCGNAYDGDAKGLEHCPYSWEEIDSMVVTCVKCCKEVKSICSQKYILKPKKVDL